MVRMCRASLSAFVVPTRSCCCTAEAQTPSTEEYDQNYNFHAQTLACLV